MKTRFARIYIYPPLVMTVSLGAWYGFVEKVLKIDLDTVIVAGFGGSGAGAAGFKAFFVVFCITLCILWILLNRWVEEDPDKKIAGFFTAYGKFIALLAGIDFLAVVALLVSTAV